MQAGCRRQDILPNQGRARPERAFPRQLLSKSSKKGEKRVVVGDTKPNGNNAPLWQEARGQARKGRLSGQRPCSPTGEIFGDNEIIGVGAAFRLCVQQGSKPWAVNDPNAGETNGAAAIHTPANLPSRDRTAQVMKSFRN